MNGLRTRFVSTLEIAIFLSLAFGYYFGSFTYKGLGLGAVTATLIAAVIIGQLNIPVTGPLRPFFFLMFLFAIGYAVGPQFVRGIASDGIPQALFAVVVCVFCLIGGYLAARFASYDVGSAAGLYAGSQTISASMGLATDAISRLGLPPEETKSLLDAMPVAYAVSYIFGTIGSAIIIALLGPAATYAGQPQHDLIDRLADELERSKTIDQRVASQDINFRLHCFLLWESAFVEITNMGFRDCWFSAVASYASSNIALRDSIISGSTWAFLAVGRKAETAHSFEVTGNIWMQSPATYRPNTFLRHPP